VTNDEFASVSSDSLLAKHRVGDAAVRNSLTAAAERADAWLSFNL
jgi:hypothetical protein